MPKGPNSQKRPGNSIGMSVMVAKIATGEVQETESKSGRRASGKAGGKARAASLSGAKRSEIAKAAAKARWSKKKETVMNKSKCDTVANIFEKKRQEEGLLDVKFLLKNRREITHTQACDGFEEFQDAIASGEGRPLDFGDLNWK